MLTNRELEVLYLIAYEFNNSQIAEILELSHHTIHAYRRRLLLKIDAKNSAGLIRKAFELKLLPISLNRKINAKSIKKWKQKI